MTCMLECTFEAYISSNLPYDNIDTQRRRVDIYSHVLFEARGLPSWNLLRSPKDTLSRIHQRVPLWLCVGLSSSSIVNAKPRTSLTSVFI